MSNEIECAMAKISGKVMNPTERETAATEVVEYRARIMGAGTAATAWGCLGARNAVKAGESAHRAIEVGTARVVDIMEAQE